MGRLAWAVGIGRLQLFRGPATVAARHGGILPKEMSEADLIAYACQRIDDFLKMIAARPINKDIPQQTLALLANGTARNQ